jgi:glyoxalase/bleomycin resistance protein/dioxygenase superfamily protein
MIKRFDSIDVATGDLADAASIYKKNFDFKVQQTGDEAIVEIGGAHIRLRSGAAVAELISSSGEGLAALWLETDNVERIAEQVKQANVVVSPIRVEGNRRILAVDPGSANMVPLFIFDRYSS